MNERLRENTKAGYNVNIENHIIPHMANVNIAELTDDDIDYLTKALHDEGLSNKSIVYVHATLRKMINFAIKRGYLSTNVYSKVDLPRIEKYSYKTLSVEDLKNLLKTVKGTRIEIPVILAACYGMRRGEILGLRGSDFDKTTNILHIQRTKTKINGKTVITPYGIRFDEGATAQGDNGLYGPYRQRQRKSIYHVFAKKLVEEGQAYPCFCTEEELSAMHAAQEAEKANFGYFGKWAVWRDRPIEDIEAALKAGIPWVLRFRSAGSIENKFKFTDLIKGVIDVTENDIDVVILKSDGIPTYHFAHVIDDHLMHTTIVFRGDEWIASLPVHLQLSRALGFKPPKYAHIGPLMIMDGTSKRKVSKRKDPQFGMIYYEQNGFPVKTVYEYLLTILNSNFEDWRRANPDAPAESFPFSVKKMNPAGSLFDAAKLADISKNVVSKMTADEVFTELYEWAVKFDSDFAAVLADNPDYAKAIISIGRGGKKPRKDYGTWVELKDYMSIFYDGCFKVSDEYPNTFDTADIVTALEKFSQTFSASDDQNVWFEKIKSVADGLGYASDMKEYKATPENFRGSVADISMFLRVAVTGRLNSPDMYTVMQILGENRTLNRTAAMIKTLKTNVKD